jgi:hypothetical protein
MHLTKLACTTLLALTGMVAAHAEIDFNVDVAGANAPGAPDVLAAQPGSGSPIDTADTADTASLGGAILNPFSQTQKSGETRGVQTERKVDASPTSHDPGLGLTIAAGLVGATSLLWLLRRSAQIR